MTEIKGLFFLDQHGCAKNKVDGELLIHRLTLMGLTQTFEPEKADFIIVNSCGFIESAKKESLDAVYGARSAYPNAKILLTGCLAERYAQNCLKLTEFLVMEICPKLILLWNRCSKGRGLLLFLNSRGCAAATVLCF